MTSIYKTLNKSDFVRSYGSRHFFAVFFSVAILFSASVTAHAQSLKKEQAVELAETILRLDSFTKYKGTFVMREKDNIAYDAKSRTWNIDGKMDSFVGSPTPIFQIRDADGFFMIGILGDGGARSQKLLREFRTHPTVARKYRQLTGKK